jgi:ATP-dependent Lon protease
MEDLDNLTEEPRTEETVAVPDVLPVMALKDLVVFPFTIVPLSVGRETSVHAVNQALASNRLLLLLTQRDATNETPASDDLYRVGCVVAIMRMLKTPDGSMRILVQGVSRAQVDYFAQEKPFFEARITRLEEPVADNLGLETEALVRSIREDLERIAALGRQISPEVMLITSTLDDPMRLTDLVASNLGLTVENAQQILECLDASERLKITHKIMTHEIRLLEMQHEISSQVRGEMDRNQREYLLRQQLKTIRQELGDIDDLDQELDEYRTRAKEIGLPEEAHEEVDKQIRRLSSMHPDSAESSVIRTWLDWMTTLPWTTTTTDNLDLKQAREILDEDHYDLVRIKERVLEFLAVKQLNPDGKSPILCFVGPPGVGKTSLGRSIARAMDRKFVRISLGGVRDEAEIRGHRRTYVGALPGRIVQSLHQAGTSNPVFMLDEVDKVGADFRGDPSSALLEVLDPEQNHTFRDHYLGVTYDLSRVLFIATANVTDTIQAAFLDRMELIRLSGYTEEEKTEIAHRHLIPRQIESNGLTDKLISFTTPALKELIDGYTREAGLRNLEREIGSICRKVAVQVAEGQNKVRRITPRNVEKLLGPRRYLPESGLKEDRVGVVTGLAYTPYGGDVLLVEAVAYPGKGKLQVTGSLGDVMKESADAALTLAKLMASQYGVPQEWFNQHNLHVHVPSGAVPKDGPSAGITILSAILSAASGQVVRREWAMTGEVTLRGEVLAIGGLKEKILAALRAGIHNILLPSDNTRDLVDLPPRARRQANLKFVRTVDEVVETVLIP